MRYLLIIFCISAVLFADVYAFKYQKDKWVYFVQVDKNKYYKNNDKTQIFYPTNILQIKFNHFSFEKNISLKYNLKKIKKITNHIYLFKAKKPMKIAQDISLEKGVEYARVVFKSKKELK